MAFQRAALLRRLQPPVLEAVEVGEDAVLVFEDADHRLSALRVRSGVRQAEDEPICAAKPIDQRREQRHPAQLAAWQSPNERDGGQDADADSIQRRGARASARRSRRVAGLAGSGALGILIGLAAEPS